jgi:hypothetical protein
MGSQGENCPPQSAYFSAKINDFHLKYCILKENAKSTTSGSNIALLPLACLKNMQTYPLWNSRGYPRDRRFLLKRLRVISFSFYVDAPFQKMSIEDFIP